MAESTCTLINVKPADSCASNFSGTGNKAYLARLTDEQRAALVYDTKKNRMTIAKSILDSIKFYEVVLKSKANKVDYKSNKNGGGYNAIANLVVDKQVDDWAVNSRIMNNTSDWILLLSTGKPGEFYFLGDPNFDNEFEDSGTTGDAPDSDKGSTVTITAGPMEWEYCKIEGIMKPDTVGSSGTFTLTIEGE